MYELKVGQVALMLDALRSANRDALRYSQSGDNFSPGEGFANSLATVLDGVILFSEDLELDSSLILTLTRLRAAMLDVNPDIRPQVLHPQLNSIIEGVLDNLERRKFMYVPRERCEYLDVFARFGQESHLAFPEASIDMIQACHSYAVSLYTASVFHAMRVAEHGLRFIAESLNVELLETRGGVQAPIPVQFANWENIIKNIESKIKELRQIHKSEAQNQELRLWSDCGVTCMYLKDLWRNEIMHSRRHCNQGEASGAIQRVSDLMSLLREKKSKPRH